MTRLTGLPSVIIVVLASAVMADPVGWRTDGTGRYPNAIPVTSWSTARNVIWVADLPSWSNATPVLTDEWVFVCSEPTTLICLRRSDGSFIWQQDHGFDQIPEFDRDREMPSSHGHNGYSSATPVIDGQHIYALFGNGVAAAYDLDGHRVWIRQVGEPDHSWGHSASPTMAGGYLIVQVDGTTIALDPLDGSTVWQQLGRHSFGSPVACRVGKLELVVTPSGNFLRARDGHILIEEAAHLEYATPVIVGDRAYFISGDARAYRMTQHRTGGLKLKLLWRSRLPKDRYYGSALIHDDLIYAITRGQKMTVLDTFAGKEVYTRKMDLSDRGGGNRIYSSPTLAGGYVFLTGLTGTTVVIKAGRTYSEVSRNDLERTRACPIFAGRQMFMRAGESLYCIGDSRTVASEVVR